MLNLIPEIIAVITAILYLVLAAKEDIKCWYAAIISASLYFFIMLDAGLLMEAILQIFYISMAIYGWNQWNKVSNEESVVRIKKWEKIKFRVCAYSCMLHTRTGSTTQKPYITL